MGINFRKCIFCGSLHDLTSEHIPPKSIFPAPRPANLITVPACKTCNQGFQKDEEYFRLAISCLCGDSTKFQNLILDNVTRQLTHQPKLATTMQRDLFPIKIDGEVLYGISSHNLRFDHIMQKIIKGLYFHEQGRRLPSNQHLTWNFMDAKYMRTMGLATIQALQGSTAKDIASGVFQYTVRFSKNGNSFWILNFYNSVGFFVVTTANPPFVSLLNSYFWHSWSAIKTIFRGVPIMFINRLRWASRLSCTITLLAMFSLQGNCTDEVGEQVRTFRDAFQHGNYDQAEIVLQKIFANKQAKSSFGYDSLRALTDRYYELGRMTDAERILINTSDGCYSIFVFKHYYEKVDKKEKGLQYIEDCITRLKETDDLRRRNLIGERAQYAITPADKKKWWDFWLEEETKDPANKQYLVFRQVRYYLALGQIREAIAAYEAAGGKYLKSSDYLFLKDNFDCDGEPLKLFYSASNFEDTKKLEIYSNIIEKHPGCKLTTTILPKAYEIAVRIKNDPLKIKMTSLIKMGHAIDNGLLGSFPPAKAWGLSQEDIDTRYDKQIGDAQDIFMEEGSASVRFVSYILSPKGEVGKGQLLPAILINSQPISLYEPLEYSLDSWTILNTDYFESTNPIITANLTSPKRKDIIVKVSRNVTGEVGSHKITWNTYKYDAKSNSLSFLQSFEGSYAGDGGESWITEIKLDDINKDGLQEVVSIERFDDGKGEGGWFQGIIEERTTRIYKYNGVDFQIDKTSTIFGFAAPNGELRYDDFDIGITSAVGTSSSAMPQRVRLVEWGTYPETMKVEFENGQQMIVPIKSLQRTYQAYDKNRVAQLCETVVEGSRFNPIFKVVKNEKIPEALSILDSLKDYGLENEYRNLLTALMRTELKRSQLEGIWQRAISMFDLYEATGDIPIQKSNIHDDVYGAIKQGERFFVPAIGQKAMIVTKRLTGNVGGAIDKNLLQQSRLISSRDKAHN